MLLRSPPHPTGWAKLRLMMVLGTLSGFASISTDVLLPALPTMQRSLGSSQNVLELVVTGYLVGFSLGQLFWGPLSDRFGRCMPIAAGCSYCRGLRGMCVFGNAVGADRLSRSTGAGSLRQH